MSTSTRKPAWRLCAAAATGILLVACASNGPRPDAQLARAEASITQADQAGARTYAGADFDRARDKLSQAKRLADQDKNLMAAQLADEARVDAELSAARARTQAAQKAAEEVRAGVATLRQETQRQEATR